MPSKFTVVNNLKSDTIFLQSLDKMNRVLQRNTKNLLKIINSGPPAIFHPPSSDNILCYFKTSIYLCFRKTFPAPSTLKI